MIDIVTTLREKIVRAYALWLARPFQHYNGYGIGVAKLFEHYINTGEVSMKKEEKKEETT